MSHRVGDGLIDFFIDDSGVSPRGNASYGDLLTPRLLMSIYLHTAGFSSGCARFPRAPPPLFQQFSCFSRLSTSTHLQVFHRLKPS